MLVALGVSHKTAPIEVREKLSFSPEKIPYALKSLVSKFNLTEAALLSTCNRTEFYCTVPTYQASDIEAIIHWWHTFQPQSFDAKPYFYRFFDEHVVQHVLRVASGLDSMVLGEPQILGQLKSAYRMANETGFIGKHLSRLFQTSFAIAKKVRTHTDISTHPVSIAFAAVTLAKQIFTDLSKSKVVLIGAGENIELVLQHLLAKNVRSPWIVNRTIEHAQKLAEQYGGEVKPFDALDEALAHADLVISSVSCEKPVITQTQLERILAHEKRRPMLMIDLGVPRNIEPQIDTFEDVYLYAVDDLHGVIQENLKNRQSAAQQAEVMIRSAVMRYMDWLSSQGQIDLVKNLRTNAQNIKEEVLSCALQKIEKGHDPKAVLLQTTHQLTQKIMHFPTVNLRKMSEVNAFDKIEVVKELFNIE